MIWIYQFLICEKMSITRFDEQTYCLTFQSTNEIVYCFSFSDFQTIKKKPSEGESNETTRYGRLYLTNSLRGVKSNVTFDW